MKLRTLPAAVAGLLVALLTPIPASAAVNCSYNAAAHEVTITLGGSDSTTVERETGADGITVGGTPCGSATVKNTDAITITGNNGFNMVTISLANGPLAPGATHESKGRSEIEITVAAGGNGGDVFVQGGNRIDRITFGAKKVNLNAREQPKDFDLLVSGGAVLAGATTSFGRDQISLIGGTGAIGGIYDAGPDNDRFIGNGNGGITMRGGDDKDTVDYFRNTTRLVYKDGIANTGPGPNDQITGVEHIIGTSLADTLLGGDGNDVLEGRGGADTFRPGSGDDTVRGGAGKRDFLDFAGAGSLVVNLGTRMVTGQGTDHFESMERIATGAGDDRFIDGNRLNKLNGRQGNDTITYKNSTTKVIAILNVKQTGKGNDVLIAIENVFGSRFDDILTGDGHANTLIGQSGADAISGMGGDDTLNGKGGKDSLDGGTGTDTCLVGPGDFVKRCEA
ncbi:MAG: calcium-binding protein [Actinomycetota bacterium]